MRIDLSYGRRGLAVELPESRSIEVIRKPAMQVVSDPAEAISGALDQPPDVASLTEIASTAKSACIAICDITRPVPNHLFLRPIIERIARGGVPLSNITILVATGLHRPNEGDELKELIGDRWVLDHVQVANHFARNDQDHVLIGTTATRGTVARIDRRFVDADLRIATGLVEPHFMAGYSGGRKVIAPGLAHAETITTFHSARFMADPAASNCNLTNNPLHQEQLEIVAMLGGAYSLDTVIDEQRRLSFVSFGEITKSHRRAVDHVRPYCQVALDRRFETVITSAAGYPLDKTYYQTVKGMVGAIDILAHGGDLIIASECSEGMGSAEFVKAQKRLVREGPDAFLQGIMKKSHAEIDEWQTQKQLEPMSVGNVVLVSELLPEADYPLTGVQVTRSIDQAVSESLSRHGDGSIAVIPEGPYVVPFYRPTAIESPS